MWEQLLKAYVTLKIRYTLGAKLKPLMCYNMLLSPENVPSVTQRKDKLGLCMSF